MHGEGIETTTLILVRGTMITNDRGVDWRGGGRGRGTKHKTRMRSPHETQSRPPNVNITHVSHLHMCRCVCVSSSSLTHSNIGQCNISSDRCRHQHSAIMTVTLQTNRLNRRTMKTSRTHQTRRRRKEGEEKKKKRRGGQCEFKSKMGLCLFSCISTHALFVCPFTCLSVPISGRSISMLHHSIQPMPYLPHSYSSM